MKQLGILIGLLVLSAGMVMALDNSSASSNSSDQNNVTTAQNGTTNQADQSQSVNNNRKQNAADDENAADQQKQDAKDAGSKQAEEHDKAQARLDDAAKDLSQLLAAPDNGIPDSVFTKAKCVAVVPSMVKGGFIFGAEHGRGVASCRLPERGLECACLLRRDGWQLGRTDRCRRRRRNDVDHE